ncbi:hypothetical protein E2562_019121 [Oryza meyeriana var. granulata]|uniref:Uncharacterized protein n=1 Tax=Oryza meyeriana var. granulata TaxID=110450 RepID=A0A6G1CT79_9ORYZ|nr:hypothetical protein E2562_019121 [Oryza meyeriana var. granulata]
MPHLASLQSWGRVLTVEDQLCQLRPSHRRASLSEKEPKAREAKQQPPPATAALDSVVLDVGSWSPPPARRQGWGGMTPMAHSP